MWRHLQQSARAKAGAPGTIKLAPLVAEFSRWGSHWGEAAIKQRLKDKCAA